MKYIALFLMLVTVAQASDQPIIRFSGTVVDGLDRPAIDTTRISNAISAARRRIVGKDMRCVPVGDSALSDTVDHRWRNAASQLIRALSMDGRLQTSCSTMIHSAPDSFETLKIAGKSIMP